MSHTWPVPTLTTHLCLEVQGVPHLVPTYLVTKTHLCLEVPVSAPNTIFSHRTISLPGRISLSYHASFTGWNHFCCSSDVCVERRCGAAATLACTPVLSWKAKRSFPEESNRQICSSEQHHSSGYYMHILEIFLFL